MNGCQRCKETHGAGYGQGWGLTVGEFGDGVGFDTHTLQPRILYAIAVALLLSYPSKVIPELIQFLNGAA